MIIELIGKFYDNHSLSVVNRNLAIALNDLTKDFYITPIDCYKSENKISISELEILDKLNTKEKQEPDIQIRHTYPPLWRWPVSSKTKIVYIQPWEFSRIPFEWQYKFENFADYLIVPSHWTKERFLDGGLNPNKIAVIPNGYNPNIYNTRQKIDTGKLTFLFVGSISYRKGLDILLSSWNKTFSNKDNVELIVKDTPQIYGHSNILHQIVEMQYKTKCGKITYNSDNLSDLEMSVLYRSSDVIVHPYRGEGFGMPILEAMACGCIPLVTNGGSTDDFVKNIKIHSEIVQTDLTNPQIFAIKPGDSLNMMGNHSWILQPSVEDLSDKLKTISNNFDKLQNKKYFNNNSNTWTWSFVAESYLNFIKSIDLTKKGIRYGLT